MLNLHQNLIVPESDWLKIGDCVLDVPGREVRAPCRDSPMRITLKTQQVLMVLVAHQGRVVCREALFEWVWPDTMPTDDVLTQAIAQLRKAFCDDRESPRYVETIARGGYRLLACVHWLEDPGEGATGIAPAIPASSSTVIAADPTVATEAQDAPIDVPITTSAPDPLYVAPARRVSVTRVATLALAATVVAIAATLALRGRAPAPASTARVAPAIHAMAIAPQPYERITSQPGSEYWPSASPDGGQVVYSAFSEGGKAASLMVQSAAPVAPHALTTAVEGTRDMLPAWSPDGRRILFTRLGADGTCKLLLIPSTGGAARTLGTCSGRDMAGYSWHPDGSRLVASGVTGAKGSIQVMDVASGQWQALAYGKSEADVDLSPVYSPDGKWIAFQRNVSLADIWRVPASGGRPQRLTRLKTNLYGLAWTPDSRSIVFAGYRDAATALLRLDLVSGRVDDLHVADVAYPSIGAKADSLAFVLVSSTSSLYSVPLPGRHGDTAPVPAFPSTGKDLLPSVSPDGTQIAFISNRSGRTGLWLATLDRPDSLRLVEGLHPVARYAAVWSADGHDLLAIGREGDHTAVYEVSVGAGRARRLPVPALDPVHAEYLPDPGRLLVVAGKAGGRLELVLFDTGPTPWQRLAAIDDVVLARVDGGGRRVLFTRPVRPGLWQADLGLGQVHLVDADPAVGSGRRLVIDDGDLWLAASDRDCGLRWTGVGASTEAVSTGPCLHAPYVGAANFSLDRVHRRLYFSAELEEGSDIGWMALGLPRAR